MNKKNISNIAQEIVEDTVTEIPLPEKGECLVCYTNRQLIAFNCDGTHRFSKHFRDTAAPHDKYLIPHLQDKGAVCCDCEMFTNTFSPVAKIWLKHYDSSITYPNRNRMELHTVYDNERYDDEKDEYYCVSMPAPPCQKAKPGSTSPCALWC